MSFADADESEVKTPTASKYQIIALRKKSQLLIAASMAPTVMPARMA
ncbi:MAG: hypothetical protein DDT30_01873 [Dehalococcoidia bacterium]|nr:hypothetical protein [Bacillota bacterium]